MLLPALLMVLASVANSKSEDACVYHLHMPKCAGTFVWRFFKGRFCATEAAICGRQSLRPPPHCRCVVNPISDDAQIRRAIQRGAYRFVSAHSLADLGASTRCAAATWLREPTARVRSHWGYNRYKRGRNVTRLSALYADRAALRKESWASNQQWNLLMGRAPSAQTPSAAELAAARAKIASLAFVGIVEDMQPSLCLFARSFLAAHVAELCGPQAPGQAKENAAVYGPAASRRPEDTPRLDAGRRRRRRDDGDAVESAAIARFNRYDAALYILAKEDYTRRLATAGMETNPT